MKGTNQSNGAVGRPLPRDFFGREPEVVARDLVGRILVVPVAADEPGFPEPILLRLTETEAYHGEADPASHAFRGRTPRTAVMFGPPGFLYTYFVYGMHWCANIVTGTDGEASAVLMRAAAASGNLGALYERRRSPRGVVPQDREIASGPARLASCLRLGRADSGADLLADSSPFHLHAGLVDAGRRPEVAAGPRVGVAAGAETLWRFYEVGEPTVTTYRPGRARVRPPVAGSVGSA